MTHTHPLSRQRILLVLGLLLAAATVLALPYRAQLINQFTTQRLNTNSTDLKSVSFPVPPTVEPAGALFIPLNPGIAPSGDPNGFHIEGDLQANTPVNNVSDWVPNGNGTGIGVLNAAGVPVNAAKTFHTVDLWDDGSDNIFAGGLKVNDDPNTWTWVTQKPPAKNDINHGLVHSSTATNGDVWFMVAGDRRSTNGDSYIDFEFLQKGLVANSDGSFTSAGTQGGRTVGDILLTIAFENGGGTPVFFVQRWTGGQGTPSGFDYVSMTPPSNVFFMTGNSSAVPVPYPAFGSMTYAINQFAEAAVNVTALLGTNCLNFTSVLIKTKTSQSASATIKDFIDPIQLNLGTRPVALAGADQNACQIVGSQTSFTVTGTATNGTPAWTVASTTGTIVLGDVTIISPNAASTAVNIAAGKVGTVTLTFTVTSDRTPPCDPAATDQLVLTVSNGADAVAPADMSKCQLIGQPTSFTLNGIVSAGSSLPLWSFVTSTGTIMAGDVTIATPNNPTTTVSVAAGKIGSVTLRLRSATTACGTDLDDVILTVAAAPTANAGDDFGACVLVPGPTAFNLTGAVTNSSGSTWSYVSSTGTITQADVTIVSPFLPNTAVNVANGKIGSVILALTAVGTKPSCANAVDEIELFVLALPNCSITGASAVCATSTNNTYTAPAGANQTYLWSITGNGSIIGSTTGQSVNVTAGAAGSYTLMLKVTNTVTECETTCTLPVTVNANPTCSIAGANAVCATSTGNTYTGPAGANLSYAWSVTGNGSIVGSNTGQSVNVTAGAAGSYTVNLTVTNTQTNCTSSCSQRVTVNENPACSIAGAVAVCATSTNNTYTGPAGANLSYAWSVTGNGSIVGSNTGQSVNVTAGAAGSYTVNLTVTNTQTNCASSCSQQVTVNGLPACSITGPDSICVDPIATTYTGPTGANLSYQWSISGNGTISGSSTGQTVNVNGTGAGSLTLTLVVTNTATNCRSTCTKQVTVTECLDCGPKGPGLNFPAASEASDQKAGSVLIYNLYTSSSTDPAKQNTRLNITNVSQLNPIAVHLFFVSEGCSVADSYLCLTQNQTSSFLASDLDPGTSGYLVAVAVDCNTGCPVSFNCLIGDEYVKLASGHATNLGAEAIAATTQTPVACDTNSVTATINFDGVRYNRIPRVLALDSVGSRADGNDTLLVINRIGGNLGIGAATLSSMFGIFYDDAENALSYTFSGSCQFRSSLSNNFPRITPRFETFIPAGRTGWSKLWIAGADDNKGILGAAINFNANAAASAGSFNQGHNLHALRLDTINSYTIPVFPPNCCQ